MITFILTAAVIIVVIGALTALGWYLIERGGIAIEERAVRRNFEAELAAVELPPWDGATYDWPENLSGYLDDVYVSSQPPSPDAMEVEHGYDAAADAAAYIETMRSQTQAFLARLAEV